MLYLGYDPDDFDTAQELDSFLSSNFFSFKLDPDNELSEHPKYSGLADFGDSDDDDESADE